MKNEERSLKKRLLKTERMLQKERETEREREEKKEGLSRDYRRQKSLLNRKNLPLPS